MNLSPGGVHCVLELYGCPADLLDDPDFVRAALREAADRACSTLLKEVSHRFEPQGVTALGLLAESHISIHTWPESGYVAADIFTCGDSVKPEHACHYLARVFQATSHQLILHERGDSARFGQPRSRAPDSLAAPPRGEREDNTCRAPSFERISG